MHKLESIPEACGIWIGEEEGPGLAAVGGFVEAGLVAGAGGHDDGGVGVEGLDAAEVEVLGVGWDGAALPEVAGVFGAEDGAVGAGGPGDTLADVVDAAEVGGGGGLDGPLGLKGEGCGCGESEEEGGDAHDESLPQGLKPLAQADVNGTAEAVPLRGLSMAVQDNCISSRLIDDGVEDVPLRFL